MTACECCFACFKISSMSIIWIFLHSRRAVKTDNLQITEGDLLLNIWLIYFIDCFKAKQSVCTLLCVAVLLGKPGHSPCHFFYEVCRSGQKGVNLGSEP